MALNYAYIVIFAILGLKHFFPLPLFHEKRKQGPILAHHIIYDNNTVCDKHGKIRNAKIVNHGMMINVSSLKNSDFFCGDGKVHIDQNFNASKKNCI